MHFKTRFSCVLGGGDDAITKAEHLIMVLGQISQLLKPCYPSVWRRKGLTPQLAVKVRARLYMQCAELARP